MKNLIRIERQPGKEYQFIALYPDGSVVPGVQKVTILAEAKSLPVIQIQIAAFDLMGQAFPMPGMTPEVKP